MSQVRRPPVSLSEWMQQAKGDPSIHFNSKNGPDGQLKVSSTAFKSGSEISATEYLHLNIIWHNYANIEALGHLMKDDPDISYAGYVSAENMEKADSIFKAKKHKWQNYFDELEEREAEENNLRDAIFATRPLGKQTTKMREDHPIPSLDPNNFFWWPLHSQLLAVTATNKRKPTTEDIKRTSKIMKPGPGSSVTPAPFSINQPVSPSPKKVAVRLAQDQKVPQNESTPQTRSFLPAKGGKLNKPAYDECYVNSALVTFLQSIKVAAGSEFNSLNWLAGRIGFTLIEETESKEASETEDIQKDHTMNELMEARVDGYLCQTSSSTERELNTDALAILEVKPFTLKSALASIRRQEGAEMACWISEEKYSTTGLLQSSSWGNKRRLMVTQHRHEIYVVVAEYGVGYEEHLRPSVTATKDPTREPNTKAGKSSGRSSTSTSSTQQNSSVLDAPATPKRRNPELLAGSPEYIKCVEKNRINVSADGSLQNHIFQPTRPRSRQSEWAEDDKWAPDVKDFLVMHEFGPFLTMNALHMEVLSKRVIAFMLQLSQPRNRSVPDPTDSDSSSDQP